jgi:outer membrane protein TolC
MKYRFVFASIILIAGSQLSAQIVYDLNNCIETGLANNFSITIARNRETISENNYTRGNAGYMPTIDFSSRFSGTVNTTEQRLASGDVNTSRNIHNTSATGSVSLGWSIFRGFSVQTTYKRLGELRDIGELTTQLAIENLIARIVAEYNYFIQQKRLYSNLKFAVDLSRERLRIDEASYLLGRASKLQLLQSKVYLNADSSRLARQNEVLRSSEIRLNELMSVNNLGQTITVADTILTIDPELVFDKLLVQTLNQNTALQIASRNQTISQYDYKIIASRSYPYVTLSSGYSGTLNMYETGNTSSQITNGANYGLTVGVNLFDGYNKQKDRKNALLELENRELQYQQVEQEVRADLLTIYSAYNNNLRLLKLEEQNLETARENLDIAFERYLLGNLSGLDLREVQKSLLDAEERLLSVQYQTKTAEISLLQISGRIMDYMK